MNFFDNDQNDGFLHKKNSSVGKGISMFKTWIFLMAISFLSLVLIILFGIGYLGYSYFTKPDDQNYVVDGDIKSLYIDDDACYHFTTIVDGKGQAYNDRRNVEIYYNDTVSIPLVKIHVHKKYDIFIEDWITRVPVFEIYLPSDYEIPLFEDGIL